MVLVIAHGSDGTVGLVLNRPTSLMFGRKKGGLPFSVEVRAALGGRYSTAA